MPKLLWKNNKEPIFCFPREQILVLPSNGSYSRFHRCVVLLNFKFCVCVCVFTFLYLRSLILSVSHTFSFGASSAGILFTESDHSDYGDSVLPNDEYLSHV